MRFFPDRVRRVAIAAFLAVGLGVGSTNAGLIDPGLTVDWWVNGVYVATLAPTGTYNEAQGWWNYTGFATDLSTGVTLNFNLNGDPDPLITGNLTLENPLLPVVNVTLIVTLPIAPTLPNGSQMQGSAAVGLTTDSGGGSMSTFGGHALWQGLIDGVAVGNSASLFFDPFLLSNAGLGSAGSSANFGAPVMVPGPSVLQSIGIEINLSLTQNDQASITSVFFVIPAPGVIGLLAIGALGIKRRRRR